MMPTVLRSNPDTGLAVEHLGIPALGGLAFPWLGNHATTLSPLAIVIALLLLVMAAVAFVLAWELRAQVRRNRLLQGQLHRQRMLEQATLDALPFPVWLQGLDGQTMGSNLAGRAVPEAVEVIHSASLATHRDRVLLGDTFKKSLSFTTAEGEAHAAQLWIRAVRDQADEARGYASTLLDVAEFQDLDQATWRTEQLLSEMAQRLLVVVMMLRVDGDTSARLLFVAGDSPALFNMGTEELRDADGMLRIDSLRERIHPDDLQTVLSLLSPCQNDAAIRDLDFRAFGQQGLRWIHASFSSRAMPNGSIDAMGYFVDTTEQSLRSEALRIARDVAERASKAKADFLATMSHEIRTPMNGVIGMLELLGRTPVSAEQRELLRSVNESSDALLQILNDILDFSKLEAGDLRLHPETFDPRRWLDSAIGAMTATARAKGLALQLSVAADVAGELRGDPLRLRQIVTNLLNNAVKFTDAGGVSTSLTVVGDSTAQQYLALSVTDTGIGIASDRQETLFKPFAQAEAWTSRRYGGTGLGLAICQQLVQLMDGQIQLQSELDRGTTVTVLLRLPIVTRPVQVPPGLRGRHAIVRLASPVAARALEQHLRAAGLSVECIDESTPWREGMAASLLFIDPDDRDSPDRIHAHTVVVAAEPPGRQITWLPAQPLTWQAVVNACLHALGLEATGHWRDAQVTEEITTLRGRVLVVEDHPVTQRLITKQLTLLGLASEVVDNGHDALEILSEGDYALLLTDCNMPKMSGYELARAWRQHEAETQLSRRLPILAMTANALSSESARAKDAGMDDVLTKPLRLATLRQKLGDWLGQLAPSADEVNALSVELQALLIEESHRDLLELERYLAHKDLPSVMRALHRLLGTLPLLGDDALITDAERIYEVLHGPDAGLALQDVAEFAQDLARRLAT